MSEPALLERRLAREQLAREEAERQLEEKSRTLHESSQQFQAQTAHLEAQIRERDIGLETLRGITENLPGVVFRCVLKPDGTLEYPFISAGSRDVLDYDMAALMTNPAALFRATHDDDIERFQTAVQQSASTLEPLAIEYRLVSRAGRYRWVRDTAKPRRLENGDVVWDGLLLDITERKELEMQLNQAQKLEAIGQLAAGIAHEINTPTQYVGDNVRFLQDAFADLVALEARYAELQEAARAGPPSPELMAEVDQAREQADVAYLSEEVPQAISEALNGIAQITRIVGAMKQFSHPGGEEKEAIDLNSLIDSTITVARNEWKYVAEMVTRLDEELPPVPCLPPVLSQVLLNLIVNAAHAIAEMVGEGRAERGTITITTGLVDEWVEVRVADTGPGIPATVRTRIFDPFFTTKEVGKGTGQGLAIARSGIVDKHGGTLSFETAAGQGTTFIVRLPLSDGQEKIVEAAA